jgi:2-oxoisovalerate dehydrogenase E2 component (dihydrolipoyl transacylase)
MGEYVVKLPDVGEGIAEAEIVEWHVQVGEMIAEDDVMVEVMTDKATVELPSPVAGTVLWVGGAVGDIIPVGSPLIRIDVGADGDEPSEGPSTTTATEHPETPPAAPAPPPPAPASPPPAPVAPSPPEPVAPSPPEPVAASPDRPVNPSAAAAVRQRAKTLGVDLADVVATGPDGRIDHADLDAHLLRTTSRTPASHAGNDTIDDVPVVGLRRNIAKRMQVAKTRIPHFTYVEEVDVTEVERLRAEVNQHEVDGRSRLTVLPFLMRAVVVAIRDFPQMNARYDDENGVVHRHRSVHLGVATQTPKGLMVPVVTNAEARDLWDSSDEVSRLSTSARDSKITLKELIGSTITISSLGSLGGIVSTPIINYPEVAIIGVNKITTRPVYVDGVVLPRQIMNLSSSFDHRVIDGADAASFIQRIKSLLETPALLFLS